MVDIMDQIMPLLISCVFLGLIGAAIEAFRNRFDDRKKDPVYPWNKQPNQKPPEPKLPGASPEFLKALAEREKKK